MCDIYGYALTAHTGWSQGLPDNNTSSQLTVNSACPVLRTPAPLSRGTRLPRQMKERTAGSKRHQQHARQQYGRAGRARHRRGGVILHLFLKYLTTLVVALAWMGDAGGFRSQERR